MARTTLPATKPPAPQLLYPHPTLASPSHASQGSLAVVDMEHATTSEDVSQPTAKCRQADRGPASSQTLAFAPVLVSTCSALLVHDLHCGFWEYSNNTAVTLFTSVEDRVV